MDQTAEVMSKPNPVPEPIVTWVVPLTALCLIVGSLGMAVRSGQILWMSAGVITYIVCVAMWAVIGIHSLTVKASSNATPAAPVAVTGIERGPGASASFSRFANWFLPSVALAALTAASLLAALINQQKWLTAGMVSFVGSALIWLAMLFVPLLLRPPAWPTAPGQSSDKEPRQVKPLGYIAQLLLSLLCLSSALMYAVNAAHTRWLGIAIACFAVYQMVAGAQATAFHDDGLSLRWTVIPGVGVGLLILGLGWAVNLHRVSWIIAAVIGACGCVMAWIIPALAQSRAMKPSPSDAPQHRIPALAIAGLMIALGLALYEHKMSALQAVLLALFGGLAVWFSWMVITAVDRDGAPQVESNWGGIGGGMGGWRCSPSIIYALCTMVFALCAAFSQTPRSDADEKTASEKISGPVAVQDQANASKATLAQPEPATSLNASQPASAQITPSQPATVAVKEKK